tara:strand:+ start:562 stop:942 length:381 start_codon:yes stop_codon:yes gene_type:complete
MKTIDKAVCVLKNKYSTDSTIIHGNLYISLWNNDLSDTIDVEVSQDQVRDWANEYKADVWNKVYKSLSKAQDKCFEVDDRLFDMCTYHMDIIGDEDLTDDDAKNMLEFADSVYKIAKLRKGLKPLV